MRGGVDVSGTFKARPSSSCSEITSTNVLTDSEERSAMCAYPVCCSCRTTDAILSDQTKSHFGGSHAGVWAMMK